MKLSRKNIYGHLKKNLNISLSETKIYILKMYFKNYYLLEKTINIPSNER